ncbi:MAG TPA: ankyrin repeat domain-containing protein [Coriobacteriia bacterium]
MKVVKVFFTSTRIEADEVVFVTDDRHNADYAAYPVQAIDAERKVFRTDNRYSADRIVVMSGSSSNAHVEYKGGYYNLGGRTHGDPEPEPEPVAEEPYASTAVEPEVVAATGAGTSGYDNGDGDSEERRAAEEARRSRRWTPRHEEMFAAVDKGDTAGAMSLLEGLRDLDAQNPDRGFVGRTILHQAVSRDLLTVAEALVRAGADIEAPADNDTSPLSLACSAAMVESLVGLGASVHRRNENGVTPLAMVTAHSFGEDDRVEAAKALIAHGADVNTAGPIMPLAAAASHGNLGLMELYLSNGAEVDARTGDGGTPLMRAAGSNQLEAAELLLAHGASIGLKRGDGFTAASLAATLAEGYPEYRPIARMLRAKERGSQGVVALVIVAVCLAVFLGTVLFARMGAPRAGSPGTIPAASPGGQPAPKLTPEQLGSGGQLPPGHPAIQGTP